MLSIAQTKMLNVKKSENMQKIPLYLNTGPVSQEYYEFKLKIKKNSRIR